MVHSPCKDCPDRWIDIEAGKNCRMACEKFADYRGRVEAAKRNESNLIVDAYIFDKNIRGHRH